MADSTRFEELQKASVRDVKAVQVTQFDLEHIQTVAEGCPRHPAYRVRSSIPDFTECQGCAKVFAATAMLCTAGLLSIESTMKADRERKIKART